MNIKTSAIIYSGYEYQTLQGILILAYWLNSPTAFHRICFEADSSENEVPQGIDDIVCERADGKIDFRQVKFTPSPDKNENAFSWDWLLTRNGKTNRSRSILKKLSDAIIKVPPDQLGDVILITNKIPDREVEACFKNGKLNYDFIELETRIKIIDQLGSENLARTLFTTLQIQHSEGGYQSIFRTVRSELERHSNDDGINRLLIRAREWAILKHQPSSGGWIYLHNIREILSLKRPEPIPESFSIPENYCLPDEMFHTAIQNKIIRSSGEIITLTGDPGKGKSTYLSYLCQALEEMEIPTIRHHYFLSVDDQTYDRFSPRIVAESLLSQINSNYRDVGVLSSNSEDLRTALEQCAAHYKEQDKPFVLIVDGLDHVWRDNDRNKKPLDEFFRVLLPVPNNLVLLVGTQPLDESMLPNILLEYCPQDTWRWLPGMTENSIYQYLYFQVESGRLYMDCHADMVEDELNKAAKELTGITSGYPLHVIYSCEYLAQNGSPLSSWTIKHLPPCENSHIASYYQIFWRRLSHNQKDVLHLCCGFQFIWPRESFITILSDSTDGKPSLNAVSHLLFETKSGVRPFHESLIVFIRKQAEHDSRISALIDNVCVWLNDQAPEHLRNSWYWLCLAKSGNTMPLREGVTRDWILDRGSEGYNTRTLIRLLEEAESIAFNQLNYSEAYKHRVLKTRLYNGSEFQILDFFALEMISLLLAPISLIDSEVSQHRDFTATKLATLSIVLWQRGDLKNAKLIAKKAIDKHKTQRKFNSRNNREESDSEAHIIIKAGVLSDALNYEFVFAEDNFVNWPDSYMKAFKDACLAKSDIALMMRALNALGISNERQNFELSTIRVSVLENFDVFVWQEFLENSSHPATKLLKIHRDKNFSSIVDNLPDNEICEYYQYPHSNYHEWFFSALVIKLRAEGDFSWLPAKATKERVNITFYLNTLTEFASCIADLLVAYGEIDFITISDLLTTITIPEESSYDSRRETIFFKRAWLEISADVHLLTTQRNINLSELQEVIDQEIYLFEWIRLWYSDVQLNLLSDEAAQLFLEIAIDRQSQELEDTSERSNNNLELAYIALRHKNKGYVEKLTRLCWDYTIGYGNHKDTTILNVLDAIDYLSIACPSEALIFLERIAPIVFNISKFTDGDETRHSLSIMSEMLAKLSPSVLASKYDQEVQNGEWYDADMSLSALLEHTNFNSSTVGRFCLTGLSDKCHRLIAKKTEIGDKRAETVLTNIQKFLGIDLISQEEETKSNISNEKIDIDPTLYPPDQLVELEKALAGKYSTRIFWLQWYSYWVDHGREQELLHVISNALSTSEDRLDDKKYLYDSLFHSSKKFYGKKKAFDFLVAAQINMNGWSDWYESRENSSNRLKIVATIYPERVDEFILKSTKSSNTWRSGTSDLIIPNDKLIYLLVESGKTEEASKFTDTMIEKLEEDTRNLPLVSPNWDWDVIENTDDTLIKMLLARLKWPVPSIKFWVSQQLSEILVEAPSQVENVLFLLLNSCRQESECIEVLSVFLMAKDLGYRPSEEIGKFIHSRSILSDMLIEDIGLIEKGNFSTNFEPIIMIQPENNSFEKDQGNHVPLIYKSALNREQKETGIPFVEFYKSEWNRTFEYAPAINSDISYFFGSEREGATGQFYTNSSHRGRSAFLRSIEIGRRFFSMPDNYAKDLATHALPIEPAYIRLRPSKPNWLPEWIYGDNVKEETLFEFINKCISNLNDHENTSVLGALSFPIQIDQDCWLDFTILRGVILGESLSTFSIENRTNGFSIGEKLNRHITYVCDELGLSKEHNIIQLTGSTYPLSRYGHWHSDLETRGIHIPLTYDKNREIKALPFDGELKFLIDEHMIGKFAYWNYHWDPIHPKGLNSLCGTYTLLSSSNLDHWMHNKLSGKEQVFMCKVSQIRRDRTFASYETNEILITVPTK